jgi:hypothetical protein
MERYDFSYPSVDEYFVMRLHIRLKKRNYTIWLLAVRLFWTGGLIPPSPPHR